MSSESSLSDLLHLQLPTSHQVHLIQRTLTLSLRTSDRGEVYAAGYGAIGQGVDTLSTTKPISIHGLKHVRDIRAGFSGAAAVTGVWEDLLVYPSKCSFMIHHRTR